MTSPTCSKDLRTAEAQICLKPGWAATIVQGDDGQPELIASYGAVTRRLRSVEEAREFVKLIGAPAAAEFVR